MSVVVSAGDGASSVSVVVSARDGASSVSVVQYRRWCYFCVG